MFRMAVDPAKMRWDHAEGWPTLLESMGDLVDPESPVVFDDSIERSFHPSRRAWDVPDQCTDWFGVTHFPPNFPNWYNYDCAMLREGVKLPQWKSRVDKLRFTIALTETSAPYIAELTGKPVVSLKYPADRGGGRQWEPGRFTPNLVQIGWFLRDTTAIYRIEAGGFEKIRLTSMQREWMVRTHERCQRHIPQSPHLGRVTEISWLSNTQYDEMLSTGVVFSHFIAVEASTLVGECVSRATPLLVNRRPALEEYLGKDYPLFYDHFDQIPGLLDFDNVVAAHYHIKEMDRSWTRVENFRKGLISAYRKHIG